MNTALEQGKVTFRGPDTNDPEDLIEEFLNGIYFGDKPDHGHTNVQTLDKLCVTRDNHLRKTEANPVITLEATGPDDMIETVGTTAYVRGGLCLKDRVEIVNKLKPAMTMSELMSRTIRRLDQAQTANP